MENETAGDVEVKCEIIEISDEEVNLGPKKRKKWVFEWFMNSLTTTYFERKPC